MHTEMFVQYQHFLKEKLSHMADTASPTYLCHSNTIYTLYMLTQSELFVIYHYTILQFLHSTICWMSNFAQIKLLNISVVPDLLHICAPFSLCLTLCILLKTLHMICIILLFFFIICVICCY